MEQANCPPTPDKDDDRKTVGEELFLVHLSRFSERSPDDYDREKPAHRSIERSVGEELWQVHCQRMKGVEFEEDRGEEDDSSSNVEGGHDSNVVVTHNGGSKKKHAIKRGKRHSPIQHPRRIITLRSGKHVRVSLT
mmetsp:Transcript_10406/g.22945  ORF Transcript_10406/g.22945 Transcript_10406/m.22945 type:complete len:136 (-) Transcript_10406:344-751(-)|eukprot:CAMPEP_0168735086 /NCGR_PEP_ID=MMETSP0724-20121128/9149_1 /TAXON_ID=265536 /ORGANISM="Amphiprora sp., Strain CCMP467" /LENGTH=135 /DNA_ID=CAMNT_0008782213 /DNA_START=122 /DNA_END=529 /DNA_ORIENTATION=+